MGRWEPNTRERLVRAALDLFTSQGYDATSVNEIADRAGTTKTTFFRHFADKREVLFAGQDTHARLLADAIAEAPDSGTPLELVGLALDALTAVFTPERHEFAGRLRVVVADNSELRERSTYKRAGLAAAMTDALHARDVPEPMASLAAELGVLAFYRGFDRWSDPANEQACTALTRQALDELRTAAATLA